MQFVARHVRAYACEVHLPCLAIASVLDIATAMAIIIPTDRKSVV